MASTAYVNVNGLPNDGQVTTARDIAVLARALWRDFPDQRYLFGIPAIKAGKKVLRSQNTLLERFRGANGMKTGFICASGFNMVGTATRSGKTLAAVVLGADSVSDRTEMAASLLQDGFKPRSSPARSRRSPASRRRGRPGRRSTCTTRSAASTRSRRMTTSRCSPAPPATRRSCRASGSWTRCRS
jgi:D-alanyl-D-alanine carboxypeptidase